MTAHPRAARFFGAAYEAYLTLPKTGFALANKALEPMGKLDLPSVTSQLSAPPDDDPFFARSILLEVLDSAREVQRGYPPVELFYPQAFALYRMVTERPAVIEAYRKGIEIAVEIRTGDAVYRTIEEAVRPVRLSGHNEASVESLIVPLFEDLGTLYIKSKKYSQAKEHLIAFRDLPVLPLETRVTAYQGLSDLAMIEKNVHGAVKILEDFRRDHPEIKPDLVQGWLDDLVIHQLTGVEGGEMKEDQDDGRS